MILREIIKGLMKLNFLRITMMFILRENLKWLTRKEYISIWEQNSIVIKHYLTLPHHQAQLK